jgi:hypothetical protein
MQLSIKNLKFAEFASDETNCFSCTLYIDGKAATRVSNQGQGGPNMWDDWKVAEKLDAYGKTLPILKFEEYELEQDADTLVDALVSAALTERENKRICKNKTVFRVPGKEYKKGEYSVYKKVYDAVMKEFMFKKFGKDVFILNETI